MNHRKVGRKFSRVRKQRRALIKGLLESLVMREKMTTTEAKAKELKSLADKVITKVKKGIENKTTLSRELSKTFSDKAIKKLTGDFVKSFDSRKSGYTRVLKLGRRKGDSAKMAVIEFVKD